MERIPLNFTKPLLFSIIILMQVIKASVLGFCFGVRRAVEYADKALEENPTKKVYSLGPLIHNEIVLQKLQKKGLIIVEEDSLEKIEAESIVIIRAHGVSPSVTKKLEDKNCTVINATCPRVNASQKMVLKNTLEGKTVFLTGDSNHGEVKGIAGYAGDNFVLLQSESDAQNLEGNENPAILISQTTFSPLQFEKISEILKKKFKNLTICNTICPATKERQDALINLCSQVCGVLVVGGKNSANTIRLFQTAEKHCKNAAHIQNANEIPKAFFDFEKVGITAGASTPDEIISQVEKAFYFNRRKKSVSIAEK